MRGKKVGSVGIKQTLETFGTFLNQTASVVSVGNNFASYDVPLMHTIEKVSMAGCLDMVCGLLDMKVYFRATH